MSRSPRIFFYCRPYASPDKAGYQHTLVALGEGLKELGVPFCSNVSYWRLAPDREEYLFNPELGVNPCECDAVVFGSPWFDYGGQLPDEPTAPGQRGRMVFVDQSDGLITNSWRPEFRAFDLILKTHFNRKLAYPSNCRPWAFGLTNRMIPDLAVLPPFERRSPVILSNFRHSHHLRRFVNREWLPLLAPAVNVDRTVDTFESEPADAWERLQWEQTGRRHYAAYYRRLQSSAMCSCFGGCFVTPWPRNPAAWLAQRLNALIAGRGLRTHAIAQFDSFRLWESLAAGCLTLHVDLERYGILLPEMPENGKHYLGMVLDDPAAAAEGFVRDSAGWPRIARAGREWALANYGPKPTAERFLRLLGLHTS